MAQKTLRDFSAPSANNVPVRLDVSTGGENFETKAGLIMMVQASPFCGKANEDASTHLQQFLELCSTSVIKGLPQWFYANRSLVSTWDNCTKAFIVKFFPTSKTNALRGRISSFQQASNETIPEDWERLQEYILAWLHHGMDNWLILQSFYNGLT